MLYTKQPGLRWLLNDLIAEAPSTRLDVASRKQPGWGCWSRLWSMGWEQCQVSAGSPGLGSRQPADQQPAWHQLWMAGRKNASALGRFTCIPPNLPQCCNSRYFTCTAPSLQTSVLHREFWKNNAFSCLSASEDTENSEAHGASFSTTQDFLDKARKDPHVLQTQHRCHLVHEHIPAKVSIFSCIFQAQWR